MSIKKIAAFACALSMTTVMFASCGDSDSSSKADTSSKADSVAESKAEGDSAADSAAESAAESKADLSDEPYIDETTGLECFIPAEGYVQQPTEFKGYDAFLMYADMGESGADWFWSNFSGQGYPEADRGNGAFGVDADVTGDGEYTVSITADSIASPDAVTGALNPQVLTDTDNGGYVFPAIGAVVFCVDITGICDGTMVAGANKETGEWEWTEAKKNKLKEGDDANVNKATMGKYSGTDIKVEVTSIKADGKEVEFDPTKIKYGNIEDNNNCYRIEIFNEYGATKEDPPIDQTAIMFAKELSVTFTIEGLTEEAAAE